MERIAYFVSKEIEAHLFPTISKTVQAVYGLPELPPGKISSPYQACPWDFVFFTDTATYFVDLKVAPRAAHFGSLAWKTASDVIEVLGQPVYGLGQVDVALLDGQSLLYFHHGAREDVLRVISPKLRLRTPVPLQELYQVSLVFPFAVDHKIAGLYYRMLSPEPHT